MSTIIPEMQVSAFRKLNTEQVRILKSCEIVSEGEYLFTFVNGALETSGFLRGRAENICVAANSVEGLNPEEVEEIAREAPKQNRVPKKRKRRSKKELAGVG